MPLPPPDEQSKPKTPKPGEKPDSQKKLDPGGRRPAVAPPPAAEIPEIVKKHFQEKRGYANYYFNTLNQERIWKAWNGRMPACRSARAVDAFGQFAQRRAVPLRINRRPGCA